MARESCASSMMTRWRGARFPNTTARQEIETFLRNDGDLPDIIGTTWLHPDVSLGSVNCGDLWNQRRPLVAYWNTAEGPAALRIRALHDGYDYASASLFTVQDRGEVLGAVVFVTDRGDTHISLDRISGSITATDLRLRLELEGAVNAITLPEPVALHPSVVLALGPVTARLAVPLARFDGRDLRVETWAEGRRREIGIPGRRRPAQRALDRTGRSTSNQRSAQDPGWSSLTGAAVRRPVQNRRRLEL
jgi:hypothetical protein